MNQKISELLTNAGIGGNGNTRSVDEIAGYASRNGSSADVTSAIQDATEQIRQLQSTTQSSIDTLSANTEAIEAHGGSEQSAGGSLLQTLQGTASGILGGGGILGGLFGGGLLGGLFSGIAGLFGGSSQPPTFTEYQAPASQNFELTTSGGATGDGVDDEHGNPRMAPMVEMGLSGLSGLQAGGGQADAANGAVSNGSTGAGRAQITVNVQALDSQSFLDRSADIANAVRSAMLNMHSINDVIGDL